MTQTFDFDNLNIGDRVKLHGIVAEYCVEDRKHVYIGMLTKCPSLTPERNLYYCKGVFSKEVRFRSSYVQKVVEVTHE